MDISFTDHEEIPLPPEEVRILDLQASPYPDGERVRVELEITPFQKRPSGELVISSSEGTKAAALSFIETIDTRMQFTIHLRGKDHQNQYVLSAVLYYLPEIEPSTAVPGEEPVPIGDPEVIDQREIKFSTDPEG